VRPDLRDDTTSHHHGLTGHAAGRKPEALRRKQEISACEQFGTKLRHHTPSLDARSDHEALDAGDTLSSASGTGAVLAVPALR
jgi:hypothetical protein